MPCRALPLGPVSSPRLPAFPALDHVINTACRPAAPRRPSPPIIRPPPGDVDELAAPEPAASLGGPVYGAEGLLVNTNDSSYYGAGTARSWHAYPSIRLPPSGDAAAAPGARRGRERSWRRQRRPPQVAGGLGRAGLPRPPRSHMPLHPAPAKPCSWRLPRPPPAVCAAISNLSPQIVFADTISSALFEQQVLASCPAAKGPCCGGCRAALLGSARCPAPCRSAPPTSTRQPGHARSRRRCCAAAAPPLPPLTAVQGGQVHCPDGARDRGSGAQGGGQHDRGRAPGGAAVPPVLHE